MKISCKLSEITYNGRKGVELMAEKKIRRGVTADLERLMEIYAAARQFMVENGNPTQWKNGYPQREMLENDIVLERLYVVEEDGGLCGGFVFFVGDDPTYGYIEGSWRSQRPYGVIHRIAGVGGGVFNAAIAFCQQQIDHLRIDTHADNKPMQHLVEKAGFSERGIIYVDDGSPRIAYDRI